MNPVAHATGDTTQVLKRPRGRPLGSPNKVQQLARENLTETFDLIGGVKGLVAWINDSDKNKYAFYTYIYPKILGVQGVQKPSGPVITKVTNVIVDPRNNYRGTIESTVVEVLRPEPSQDDLNFEAIENNRPEHVEDFEIISGEIPL